MANYLNKYKGKYRLKANIDMNTNDFPRDMNGKIEDYDIYIKCRKGQIYHYGHSTLVCYCNSLGAGRNILKDLGNDLGIDISTCTTEKESKDGNIYKIYDYEKYYRVLEDTKVVFNIEETDSEILWKFHDKNIELMTKYMLPQTSGASISPLSTKNLPKQKYDIPNANMKEYEEITKAMPEGSYLLISHLTNRFINDIMSKNKAYKNINLKELMKKKMLKGKEFIHSEGFWSEYMQFLRENI